MKKILHSYKFWIVITIILALIASLYTYHLSHRYDILDRVVFNELAGNVDDVKDTGGFKSAEQLSSFITDWADKNSLEYKIDKGGNIIFDTPAIDRKKSVSPTVIIIGINSLTSADNAELLASALSLASTDLSSGRKIVIFANNELETGSGFKSLSSKYIGDKSKVIYMDYGDRAYISVNSYAESFSEIKIPAKKEEAELDTAVKIHISGIETSAFGPDIKGQPDPISVLGSLLTRLKSRSADYRIADFETGSYSDMYPVSLDATIMLNSYALDSLIKYLDQRIKTWDRNYGGQHPDLSFTYEIVENEDNFPDACYDADTTDLLTRVLYTINSGTYTASASDVIPDYMNIGDTCGINCMTDLTGTNNSITMKLVSQAYNDNYLNRIVMDNRAAAELNDCEFSENDHVDAFVNDKDSLLRTFRGTYGKVYDATDSTELKIGYDDRFTPCSYLTGKNDRADIIHLRLSKNSAAKLTNTLMCYIKSKGNTFTL